MLIIDFVFGSTKVATKPECWITNSLFCLTLNFGPTCYGYDNPDMSVPVFYHEKSEI